MKTEYIERGETIYFTPAANVAAGDVVVIGSKRIAIAASDIQSGAIGAAHTVGVFAMPKGADAITQGADVYWDGTVCTTSAASTAGEGDASETTNNILAGYAFAAASASDGTVAVKLPG